MNFQGDFLVPKAAIAVVAEELGDYSSSTESTISHLLGMRFILWKPFVIATSCFLYMGLVGLVSTLYLIPDMAAKASRV